MDFEKLISTYKNKTCIISVESFPDGEYGNIRIAAGNKAHCDDMLQIMHRPFVPGSPYEEYFPQNKNFEDFCYRCAIQGQSLHTYVRLPQMDLWLNMFLLPLESDQENVGYCIYSYDVTPYADSEQRASLSADTSSSVLQACIKLSGSRNVRKTFQEVIEDIRKICSSDYCGILLTDHQTRSCTLLCDSLEPGCGLITMDKYLDEKSYDFTMTWGDTIGDSTCVIIKDRQDMAWLRNVNPAWHMVLTEAGVKSIVMFPLNYNDETLGYLWSINFNIENTVKIKETLELTTFFIASEIANYQLFQRLEVLSSMDMLTGVKNRNSMNAAIGDILTGKTQIKSPCTVIMVDLNGLKRVNDEKGHAVGDQLLRSAGAVLRDVFSEMDVYRAGGDEFMILAFDITEEDLSERIKRLYDRAKEVENLHFAVGTAVAHDGKELRLAMKTADEKMYFNKNEYYNNHPERKYRS